MIKMSSDYHDVPHCIRQALAATSPAPTHYSRVSESPSHDELPFGKSKISVDVQAPTWYPFSRQRHASSINDLRCLKRASNAKETSLLC